MVLVVLDTNFLLLPMQKGGFEGGDLLPSIARLFDGGVEFVVLRACIDEIPIRSPLCTYNERFTPFYHCFRSHCFIY